LIEVYEGIIKACAIVNSNSNKEYKRVAWKVNERDNNVWIIHALAVRYEYRGMGLATQLVKNIISYAKLENIEAIHLYVIDKNTLADRPVLACFLTISFLSSKYPTSSGL
jgi:GNAT superfamily N-acetyltransferase